MTTPATFEQATVGAHHVRQLRCGIVPHSQDVLRARRDLRGDVDRIDG